MIKEVEVVKQYDMKEMMALLKKAATKQGARKVVGETRNTGEAKIVDRREVAGMPDDLTKIEGVGPKIAGLLNAGGINTFKDLSNANFGMLKRILDAAGPRYQMHDPGSWPQQAGLAAAGKWDELEKLQDRLDGGKSVSYTHLTLPTKRIV